MTVWSAEDTSVKVALRIRPQSAAEKIELCRICTSVTPDHPQVVLGKDKAFTYDFVFDLDSIQPSVYDSTARELIEGCFEGYNATILAYGQTGSGKTYTMGTGFDSSLDAEQIGIIPRAVDHLFVGINNRIEDAKNSNISPPEFKVVVQFMELYNEEIIDLLDIENKGKKVIKIHEDSNGNIYTTGILCRPVSSGDDCLKVLEEGALSRTTASTNMNATSSRSHAIFTVLVKQYRVATKSTISANEEGDENANVDAPQDEDEFESLSAKFNFVDLAGSERLKRTGATGDRAKEGISINQGLLSLGNVISALGDNAKRGCHVPYRDSKLTRLLQDSLGGNSRTVMIACVSPSDRDFMETLNTLKYANRARNIKNKVVVNQDKASKQIAALRTEIQRITLELLEYKQGIRVAEEGGDHLTDTFHENMMLRTENENLRLRIKGLQETVNSQTEAITTLKAAQAVAKLGGEGESGIEELVQGYVKEIEELNNKLIESQGMSDAAIRRAQNISRVAMSPTSPEDETNHLLEVAKKDLRKKMKRMRKRTPSSSEIPEAKMQTDRLENAEDGEKIPPTPEHGIDLDDNQAKDDKEGEDDHDDEVEEEEDLDVEESSDSDEDIEKDDIDEDSLREDIVDLSNEITIKQKLIEELEHSQTRLQALKHQYEEKLNVLQHKIKETESERDRVLRNIGTVDSKAEEKATVIRKQYEKKISSLTKELTKLQSAKREHNRLLKTKEHNEQQLKILRNELGDMKRVKVRLMKQMRDDVTKAKQRESKFNRQLESMIKENRKRDVDIKRLKEEKKQKDLILKRKQEEITSLRKQIKPVSGNVGARQRLDMDQRSGNMLNGPVDGKRTASQLRKSPQSPAVSRNAKKKWEILERKMNDLMLRMKTVANMEHDMERWLQDRDRVSKQLEHSKQRRDEAVKAKRDQTVIQDLNEQVEGLLAQMDFIQDNILESQNTITDMEEVGEIINANEIITKCSLSEARYLLEHCYGKSVELGQEVANLDAAYKEMQMRLEGLEQHCELQQQLLQHVFVEQHEMIVDAGSVAESNVVNGETEVRKDNENGEDDFESEPPTINVRSKSRKKRRLTGTPEEFLKPMQVKKVSLENVDEVPVPIKEDPDKISMASEKSENTPPNISAALLEKLFEIDPTLRRDKAELDIKRMPPPLPPISRGGTSSSMSNVNESRARANSLMGSTQSLNEAAGNTSASFQRNTRISKSARSFAHKPPKPSGTGIKSQPSSASSSPQATRKTFGSASHSRDGSHVQDSPVKQLRRNASIENSDKDISSSRVDLDNADVFTRLTSSLPQEADPDVGKMLPVKAPAGKPDHLVCTYTATGHNNAVLSMAVTEEILITGSKDRTAKVWDLSTGEEIMSLAGHKRDVTVVRYSPVSKLVFTVYQSTIKLWDIRQKPGTCVKTISGSIFQLGDSSVMDLGLNQQGSVLYSALGNTVKMVDLRTYSTLGKLSGHHGTVTCLLVTSSSHVSDIVVSGSKDHTIKVYEVVDEVIGREMPRHNLEPPHYDGVQSLALRGDVLFSGSRDNTIKKWDFKHYQLRYHLLSAHKDWVSSLNFLPDHDVLLSGCRSGSLRLWHGGTCQQLGEINAHPRSINAITTNSTAVFTASSDRLVRLWKPTSTLEEQLKEFDD